MMTGFTRIVIVLSLLRQAIGTQSAPPNQVIVGLSLFLTLFVMGPTLDRVYQDAYLPYTTNAIGFEQALEKAEAPMRQFMLKQTRQSDFALFARLAKLDAATTADTAPLRVLVPAFVTSELKSAFQIGFMIFIPFLVIDMVVSSILMSLGMMMLSPVLVALAVQADAVRAGRRLEPADRLAGGELCHLARSARMTSQMVLTIGRDALTLLLMIAMPVLGVVMAVGLLVSIFQAVTQIHEATLAFVPKLIAAMVVFAIAGPWMLSTLVDFIRRTILSIPSMVG